MTKKSALRAPGRSGSFTHLLAAGGGHGDQGAAGGRGARRQSSYAVVLTQVVDIDFVADEWLRVAKL